MRKIVMIAAAVLLALGAVWIGRKLFPSDEIRIRRALQEAAEAASVPANEGALEKLASINRLVSLCTADVRILLEAPGIRTHMLQGEEQLREAAAVVHGSLGELTVRLMDIGVTLGEDPDQATAQCIARARVDGEEDEVIQEFRIVMRRVGGDWKIQQVEPLRSLEM